LVLRFAAVAGVVPARRRALWRSRARRWQASVFIDRQQRWLLAELFCQLVDGASVRV
jgi:hypothetical protein